MHLERPYRGELPERLQVLRNARRCRAAERAGLRLDLLALRLGASEAARLQQAELLQPDVKPMELRVAVPRSAALTAVLASAAEQQQEARVLSESRSERRAHQGERASEPGQQA